MHLRVYTLNASYLQAWEIDTAQEQSVSHHLEARHHGDTKLRHGFLSEAFGVRVVKVCNQPVSHSS
jgi:hypothetical protein